MEGGQGTKLDGKLGAKTEASWRSLSLDDIPSLISVADEIHADLPEDHEVFAERVKLFPEGCFALVDAKDDGLCGYAISHPIRRRHPPILNSLLGEIVPDADQYYIHDLAILPKAQGNGLAQECVQKLFDVAKKFPTTSLVSVYGTSSFWSRFGFLPPQDFDHTLEKKLLHYGDDATYLERKNHERQQLGEDRCDTEMGVGSGAS
ncbi:hypothetical protein BCR34DRAFT_471509 [Clohesyomyces aquaticus]|uniref:N-acetyltransferase domain-containing protein n=1 Tax=Clohesyomyces aquaticus TaxID=1231657 RepID=A0A1Y2AC97_9PLEO|nr:hypothetical protein BCR34DRAFT_471509 [Clohesyomyces aquaticus]